MPLVYDRDIQSRKIFVGGLATTTDDKSLIKYFEQYGDIADCIVMFDRLTGMPKRFGFVVYAEVSSMEKCLADCPHNIDGADVNVKHADMPYSSNEKDDGGNCQIHAVFPFGSRMDKELIKIEDREGLYYENPNWIEKYLIRDLSEWAELCFPQYLKMYDPCRSNGKNEDKDENNDEDDDTEEVETEELALSQIEKDKLKYGQELKFHYLITETGGMGKALPNYLELQNP